MALLLTRRHLSQFTLKYVKYIIPPQTSNGAQLLTPILLKNNMINKRLESSDAKKPETEAKPSGNKEKLKQAVSQYGATVIVFHVAISLTSLGICYLLVSKYV